MSSFKFDFLAGLAMAAILVPQSMAYALLAGLPPEVGLYAGTVPVAVYAIFGSSLHLSVGPVALVSLLTLSAVSSTAPPGKEIEVAGLLALMVGVTSLLMGIARVGFLVNYISRPVLVGFTAAAAVIIATSQLKGLTGVQAENGDNFLSIARNFADAIATLEIGTALFERHSRGMTLTGAGRRLLPYAQRMAGRDERLRAMNVLPVCAANNAHSSFTRPCTASWTQ